MAPSDSISEHQVAAAERALRIKQRRKRHRAFGQSGEQRRLSQREVAGVFGKEVLGRSFEAVISAAEVNLVAVEREDLFFGESALDLDGEVCLLHLAHGSAVRGEKKIARQLHGERGCALRAAGGADVMPGGAGNAKN